MRDLTQRALPTEVRERLALSADQMIQTGIACRNRHGSIVEARIVSGLSLRSAESGGFGATGYAVTWDVWYDVAGGPPWGWTESIAEGAVTKSLAERDDVRFLLNHEGLPLARTSSGTLSLSVDTIGLVADVESFDLRNPRAQELQSTLERRDVDQMSWAFEVIRQEWNDDYTERRILEVRTWDVSAVTFPANTATIIAARQSGEASPGEQRGMSLSLAQAQRSALDF